MLELFCRNSSDYEKMMLHELTKNATQRDLRNISKEKMIKSKLSKNQQEGKEKNICIYLGKIQVKKPAENSI